MSRYMDEDGNIFDESNLADEIERNYSDRFVTTFESDFEGSYNPIHVLWDYGKEGAFRKAFRDWLDDAISDSPNWVAAQTGLTSVVQRYGTPAERSDALRRYADEIEERHYDTFVDRFMSDFEETYNPIYALWDYGKDGAYKKAFRDWLDEMVAERSGWIAARAGMREVFSKSSKSGKGGSSAQRSSARKPEPKCGGSAKRRATKAPAKSTASKQRKPATNQPRNANGQFAKKSKAKGGRR